MCLHPSVQYLLQILALAACSAHLHHISSTPLTPASAASPVCRLLMKYTALVPPHCLSCCPACSPCLLMNKRCPPHCCIIPPHLVLLSTMHLSNSCSSWGTLQCDSALLLASMYELPPHLTIGNSVFAGIQGLFLHLQSQLSTPYAEGNTTARTPLDTFSDPCNHLACLHSSRLHLSRASSGVAYPWLP
jgi:hypothetical protein